MVEIRPVGRVAPLDDEGYIVGDVDAANIRAPWDAVVREIAAECGRRWGERLHSVYVRGSLPRGLAVEGVSDVDAIAVVTGGYEDLEQGWIGPFLEEVDRRYPFQTGAEIAAVPLGWLRGDGGPPVTSRAMQFTVGTNCVCVAGEDLGPSLPRFRPGRDIASQSWYLPRAVPEATERLARAYDASTVRWIMKRLLRTGYELVMERERAYTRDLYYCWQGFSRHYPGRSRDMRRALELAVDPSDGDAAEALSLLRGLGSWEVSEVGRVFPGLG
jgi:hypothetical protein